jgi:hypothetical protein
MQSYRVSIRFSRLPDPALNPFVLNVIQCMTGNPAFPAPLIPLSQLATLQTNFQSAITASDLGGRQATAAKNTARTALLTAMRTEANYVQGVARHELSLLLSSGFQSASQNRTPATLATPAISQVVNETTEQLTLRGQGVANARNYQVQMQVDRGDWQDLGIFSQARRIVATGLTPGKVYTFRMRALGGRTGYSQWSNIVSRMSI